MSWRGIVGKESWAGLVSVVGGKLGEKYLKGIKEKFWGVEE